MDPKIGMSHLARKELFRKGVQERQLTVEEIETALPAGALTPAERWLFYYSLRAAEIEIVGDAEDLEEGRSQDLSEPIEPARA